MFDPSVISILLASMVPHVRAEHAKIILEVAIGTENVAAHVDQTPPEWGKNPRPVVKARVNEPIRIQLPAHERLSAQDAGKRGRSFFYCAARPRLLRKSFPT